MEFENIQNQESSELSKDEIADLQTLKNRLLKSSAEFSDPENRETIINQLYTEIEEGFLDILPVLGFERDESLENSLKEEGLSDSEKTARKEKLLREYVKRMQDIPVGWGFTPAIASRKEKEFQGLDCLGATIALTALLRKNGIEVRKGQTAGHALVLAKTGDTLWYADGRNGILLPISEQGKNVKNEVVYELSPGTTEKLDLPYNLLISSDIQNGSIASIFDNVNALKDISSGLDQTMADKDIAATDRLYKENKELLDSRDWADIGTRLTFPEGRFMDDSLVAWEKESERIKDVITGQNEAQRLISELFIGLGYKTGEDILGIRKKIIRESLSNKHGVLNFLSDKSEVPSGLSDEVTNFLQIFKEKLDELRQKSRIETVETLLRMIAETLERYTGLQPIEDF